MRLMNMSNIEPFKELDESIVKKIYNQIINYEKLALKGSNTENHNTTIQKHKDFIENIVREECKYLN